MYIVHVHVINIGIYMNSSSLCVDSTIYIQYPIFYLYSISYILSIFNILYSIYIQYPIFYLYSISYILSIFNILYSIYIQYPIFYLYSIMFVWKHVPLVISPLLLLIQMGWQSRFSHCYQWYEQRWYYSRSISHIQHIRCHSIW
jgi:hypothetical protein